MKRLFILLGLMILPLFSQEPNFTFVEDKNPLSVLSIDMQDIQQMKIQLKNGMKVLLISDPKCKKSASALSVNIGHVDNPHYAPGLAHFCEHMLFMGSSKYPDEKDFHEFLDSHFGSHNAYTAHDRTVYMFSIANEAFFDALDRFSYFFSAPLFQESSFQREKLAVHQEYARNLNNDSRRFFSLLTSQFHPDNELRKFATGSIETLKDVTRDQLIDWYENHYSSDRMHLVLYSPASLEAQLSFVTKMFNNIPKRETHHVIESDLLLSDEQKSGIIFFESIQEQDSMRLVFEVPRLISRDMDSKTPDFLAYLLNQGHKGSLKDTLRQQNFAKDFCCHNFSMTKNTFLFLIDIDLTHEGLAKKDEVLCYVFSALDQLRTEKNIASIYNEYKKLRQLNYQWQERSDPFSMVQEAAHDLVDESLETYPYKSYCIDRINLRQFDRLLDHIKKENCAIYLSGKNVFLENEKPEIEKWHHAKFIVRSYDKGKISTHERLANLTASSPFAPDKVSLEHVKLDRSKKQETWIEQSDFAKLFVVEDTEFLSPKVYLDMTFYSSAYNPVLENAAKNDFYLYVLKQELSNLIAMGNVALINSHICPTDHALGFSIVAFSSQIEPYTLTLMKEWHNLCISKERFMMHKSNFLQDYKNYRFRPPYRHAMDRIREMTIYGHFAPEEQEELLENLSYEDFLQFHKIYQDGLYVEGIIGGNISKRKADTLWANIKEELSLKPIKKPSEGWSSLHNIQHLSSPKCIKEQTSLNGNVAILSLYLPQSSYKEEAMHKLMISSLSHRFFDTLRTKQQTGYLTQAFTIPVRKNENLATFMVQSTTHSEDELLSRFELFFEETLKNLPEVLAKFEEQKASLIQEYSKRPQNLGDYVAILQRSLFYHHDLEYRQHMIDTITSVTKEELSAYMCKYLSRKNPHRMAVALQGTDLQQEALRYDMITKQEFISSLVNNDNISVSEP